MDKLFECAKAYQQLIDKKYRIMLGRKGKLVEINIVFNKFDFHHLMGLGKLKDNRVARENRLKVFENIINRKLKYENISKSRYISEIEDRFEPLAHIEDILDCNEIMFRYNENLNTFSLIQADFLLETPFNDKEVYIFLSKDQDNYFCRSFFPKKDRDYTKGQTKFALLYKEKIDLKTGQSDVQIDKLRN